MSKGSLRLRLLAAAAISIALALFLTGLAQVRLYEAEVRERVLAGLENDLLQLAGAIEVGADGGLSLSQPLADPRYGEPYGGRFWRVEQVTQPGQVLPEPLRSRSLWDFDIDPVKPSGPEGEALITASRDISIEADGLTRKLSLLAAARLEEVERPLADLRDQLILSLSLIGLVLIGGAWAQVTVGLRPLRLLKEQIAAIRAGKAQRLAGNFPDEVRPLVAELNDVLDMRDASLEKARRRAGDLAHGLKTPLTILTAIARGLRREGRAHPADDIEEQAAQMERHVERALARARLSSGRGHMAAALRPAAQRVAAALARLPDAEDITFEVEVPEEATVPIEQGDLMELLGNLMDNARKWARATVRVSLAGPVLRVEDDGPGVAEDELRRLGERGRRLDESKPGSGLGLSIVQDIADLYGFAVSYGRSELGGFRADIRL
jgi:signal transduction histidine kinase